MTVGTHLVSWDGTGDSGRRLASGLYFLRLATASEVESRKVWVAR